MHTRFRIEICGGIASGKTTLCNCLGAKKYFPINEPFATNPFLQDFYIASKCFSFETELCFLLQHYHEIRKVQDAKKWIACDYAFVLDQAYADVTLSEQQEHEVFDTVFNEITRKIGKPDLLIYLKCPPSVLLDRIRVRNREIETAITERYLTKLDSALLKRIQVCGVKVLEIDSEQYDFANNSEDKNAVLAKIENEVQV